LKSDSLVLRADYPSLSDFSLMCGLNKTADEASPDYELPRGDTNRNLNYLNKITFRNTNLVSLYKLEILSVPSE